MNNIHTMNIVFYIMEDNTTRFLLCVFFSDSFCQVRDWISAKRKTNIIYNPKSSRSTEKSLASVFFSLENQSTQAEDSF